MSEEQDQEDQPMLNFGAIDPTGARFDKLETMFAQFILKNQEDRYAFNWKMPNSTWQVVITSSENVAFENFVIHT